MSRAPQRWMAHTDERRVRPAAALCTLCFWSILLLSLTDASAQTGQVQRLRQFMPMQTPWAEHVTENDRRLTALQDFGLRFELFRETERERQAETDLNARRDSIQAYAADARERTLQKICHEYSLARLELLEAYRSEHPDDLAELGRQLSKLNGKFAEKLADQFSTEEWKRCGELAWWLQAKQLGILQLFQDSKLRQELRMTPSRLDELKQFAGELAREMTAELYNLEGELFQRLIAPLPQAKQRRILTRLGRDPAALAARRANKRINRKPQDEETRPLRIDEFAPPSHSTELRAGLEYSATFIETLKQRPSFREPWRDYYLPIYHQRYQYSGDLLILLSMLPDKALHLSSSQMTQLKELEVERVELQSVLGQQFPQYGKRGHEDRETYIRELRELEDTLTQRLLNELLLPHQADRLLTIHYVYLARRHGLLALLADGSLGREIKLTEKEREALFDAAATAREWFDEELTRIHDELWEQLRGRLQAEQRRSLDASFGEPPSLSFRGDLLDWIQMLQVAAGDSAEESPSN